MRRMYRHVGHAVMIREAELIAIFDRSILDSSEATRQFFDRMRALEHVHGNLPSAKSMILTDNAIYLSKISSGTLARRGLTGSPRRSPESR